ncbi:MAG: M50 family metallopeptidase [Ilumatobacteraceae bacterium]
MPSSRSAFRVLGFPVHVGSGFWSFMLLITLVNSRGDGGMEFAVLLAVLIAAFTLVHELGHALAARATGAQAEITLTFMAGYASFVPTRHLSRWERVGISFAGPGIQILLGIVLYLAMGGQLFPVTYTSYAQSAAWFAGPVIGMLNLLPILPLDGGNILEQLVGAITPKHSQRIMMWFTGVVCVGGMVVLSMTPGLRGFVIYLAFPLLIVGQMATAKKTEDKKTSGQQALARAEALAWATGDVTAFPEGTVPSPWFRAAQQLQGGAAHIAGQLLVAETQHPSAAHWWPPDAAPLRTLAELIEQLPRPLPHGRPFDDFVLSGILLRLGEYDAAAHFAAEGYSNGRPAMLAVHVARAAAALGDRGTAIAWLRTAATTTNADHLQAAVDAAPEFAALRDDPAFADAVSS